MQWVNNLERGPSKPGKYIVATRTQAGNSNSFNCIWTGKTWSCTNQIVIKWLEE